MFGSEAAKSPGRSSEPLIRGSQGLKRSGIWSLARVDQVLGDFSKLHVEVLGSLAQHVEGLVGTDPLAFDEDPLGLADQLSGDQGGLKVLGAAFLVRVSACCGGSETGH